MSVLPHFLAYVTPALLLLGARFGGAWTLLPVAFVFGLLPVLDDRVGRHDWNPAGTLRGSRWLWDLPLWLWVPTQLAAIVFVLWRLTRGDATLLETVGLTVSLGVANGSGGIVIAHELMHRRGRADRALAEILMTSVTYAHFCVEHIHGHHRYVATRRDPATSRLGEPVFAFSAAKTSTSCGSLRKGESNHPKRTKKAPKKVITHAIETLGCCSVFNT